MCPNQLEFLIMPMDDDLRYFRYSLEKLEKFLLELAANEDKMMIFGIHRVINNIDGIEWDEIDRILTKLNGNIDNCARIAPLVDSRLAEKLKNHLHNSNIEDLLSELTIKLQILSRKENNDFLSKGISVYVQSFKRALPLKQDTLFRKSAEISLESILVSLSKLRAIVEALEEEYARKAKQDDEIFKPSNIDSALILADITAAILVVRDSPNLVYSEQQNLISYLEAAILELANDDPAWRKIVGALVISATLLGGIAVAPEALKNIDSAITHILGKGVRPPPQTTNPISLPFNETLARQLTHDNAT